MRFVFGQIVENQVALSSVLESVLGDLVGRIMSRELRMYAERGNSSKIAKGGLGQAAYILRTLRERSSDVGQGKRECLENVKKHIPALVTATFNIQELQGSPECAENGEQGSIIGNGFRFQFQVDPE